MSKGSGQSTQTVQTNSTTGPPLWAQGASEALFKESQDVADKTKAATIAKVAPLGAGQMNLFGALMGNVGASNSQYSGALGTLNNLQGFGAPTITPQTLAGTDLQPYMNPFTKNVKDTALALGKQQLAQTQNTTSDAAMGAGAFGGSRHGVQSGVADSQYALGAANLGANLDAQNFQQAQAAAGTDIGNDLNAQAQNAGNAISGAGVRLNAANSATNTATQQQQTYLNGLFAALSGQNQIQANQQAQNQAEADQANAQNILPMQRLQIKQGTLSGVPLAQTTQGTQTSTKQEPQSGVMQGIGGAMGLLGSLASMGGPAGFGMWGASQAMSPGRGWIS